MHASFDLKDRILALEDAVMELLFLIQVWHFMLPGNTMPCFPVFVQRALGKLRRTQ